MAEPRKSATSTRGRPFAPGNRGKPKGARHRTTLAVQALLDGEAEGLTRRAVELALAGDTTALRLCLERIAPAPKDRPVVFALPPLTGAQDTPQAALALIEAAAAGAITPSEASALMGLLEGYRRAAETAELEARIAALEVADGRKA